jgi:hypothetical protein
MFQDTQAHAGAACLRLPDAQAQAQPRTTTSRTPGRALPRRRHRRHPAARGGRQAARRSTPAAWWSRTARAPAATSAPTFVYRAEPDGKTLLASPPGPSPSTSTCTRSSLRPDALGAGDRAGHRAQRAGGQPQAAGANVAEFIAYLKANPGKVSFASQGNGTTSHLTASLFMQLTGTEMTHVPYKGTAPALVDLIGGQVDVFFDNLSPRRCSSSAPARSASSRWPTSSAPRLLPNVPTFAEQKLPDMNAVTWFAVVAPPGTPAATVDYHAEGVGRRAAAARREAEVRRAGRRAARLGQRAHRASSSSAESAKWNKVIQAPRSREEWSDTRMMRTTTVPTQAIQWHGPGLTRIPFAVYTDAQLAARSRSASSAARSGTTCAWRPSCPTPAATAPPSPATRRWSWCGRRRRDLRLREPLRAPRRADRAGEVGHTDNFQCVYHAWSYNRQGDLTAWPSRRASRARAACPRASARKTHGPRKLRIAVYCGLVFGSFSDDVPLDRGVPGRGDLRSASSACCTSRWRSSAASRRRCPTTGSCTSRTSRTATTPACCTCSSPPSSSTACRRRAA